VFSILVPEAQDDLVGQNLLLQNSFDILNLEKEGNPGEALLEDIDVLEVSDSLDATTENSENVSDEVVSSVPTSIGHTDEHLEMNVGNLSFPTIPHPHLCRMTHLGGCLSPASSMCPLARLWTL
jgi:hypothetical protein